MIKPIDTLIGCRESTEFAPTKIVSLCSAEAYNDIKEQLVSEYRDNYEYKPIFEFDKNGDWHLRLSIIRKGT
jgi:hypothetical protein